MTTSTADLIAAWLCAWPIELLLRSVGIRRTLRWLASVPARSCIGDDAAVAARCHIAAARAFRVLPFRNTCLRRALVEYVLGRVRGLDVQLVIGVTWSERFGAHAWVELGNVASPRQDFCEIYRVGVEAN